MICPKCGAPVAEGVKYCHICGNDMTAVDLDATVLAANADATVTAGEPDLTVRAVDTEATLLALEPELTVKATESCPSQKDDAPLAEHKPLKKSGKGLMIGIAVVALAIVAVVVAVLANKFIPQKQAEKTDGNYESTTIALEEVEPSTNLSMAEKVDPDVVHKKYEDFLETAEAKKYFDISPAFANYYTDYEEYDRYVNSVTGTDKSISYFDLDGDGTDECVLSVCFYSNALDHYVYYIFDIDGEEIRCVDSATELYGYHRSLHRLQIYEQNGEYYIRKYIHDPHERVGSVYKYDGKTLEFIESTFISDLFVENAQSYETWTCFYSDKYDLYDVNASNYLAIEWENNDFASTYGIKELSEEEIYKIIDNYDNNEVCDISGERSDLWETFLNSDYFSEELDTYFECRDFNGDGQLEMFVLKFKEEYAPEDGGYIYPATVYYVTQQNIKVVEDEIIATPGFGTKVYYVGGRWFFSFARAFSSGSEEYIYTAAGENAVNATVGGGNAEISGQNELVLCFDDYDAFVDGTGHTYKYHYFYWDENSTSFKEYGAIDVDREAFLECEGALEILEKIENDGYSVIEILYRQNGIININCINGEMNAHYTCELSENNEVTFLGDISDGAEGHCKKAVRNDIAEYPNKFPV